MSEEPTTHTKTEAVGHHSTVQMKYSGKAPHLTALQEPLLYAVLCRADYAEQESVMV